MSLSCAWMKMRDVEEGEEEEVIQVRKDEAQQNHVRGNSLPQSFGRHSAVSLLRVTSQIKSQSQLQPSLSLSPKHPSPNLPLLIQNDRINTHASPRRNRLHVRHPATRAFSSPYCFTNLAHIGGSILTTLLAHPVADTLSISALVRKPYHASILKDANAGVTPLLFKDLDDYEAIF
jgi:hypothetical protein